MRLVDLLPHVFAAYSITLLLTNGEVFWWWRLFVRRVFRWFTDYPVEACRMCQGVWVSLAILLVFDLRAMDFWVIYGLSYFLATQERT